MIAFKIEKSVTKFNRSLKRKFKVTYPLQIIHDLLWFICMVLIQKNAYVYK